MNFPNLCAAALTLVTLAGGAQAATQSASTIIADQTTYGSCTASATACAANDRQTVTNALGDADGAFYSLGHNGQLTVGFDAPSFAAGAWLTLKEVTFGGPEALGHFEAVDIYSVMGGVATLVERVLNTASITTVRVAQSFEYIRLVDVTSDVYPESSSFDGFDVDSIQVAAVPLPGAGALMLAGLGGLAVLRRRRKAA